MSGYMLTTVDNKFDPRTQFDEWFNEDHRLGHNTCEYLSRMALTSECFGDEENTRIINEAIDEIIRLDFEHKYRRLQIA